VLHQCTSAPARCSTQAAAAAGEIPEAGGKGYGRQGSSVAGHSPGAALVAGYSMGAGAQQRRHPPAAGELAARVAAPSLCARLAGSIAAAGPASSPANQAPGLCAPHGDPALRRAGAAAGGAQSGHQSSYQHRKQQQQQNPQRGQQLGGPAPAMEGGFGQGGGRAQGGLAGEQGRHSGGLGLSYGMEPLKKVRACWLCITAAPAGWLPASCSFGRHLRSVRAPAPTLPPWRGPWPRVGSCRAGRLASGGGCPSQHGCGCMHAHLAQPGLRVLGLGQWLQPSEPAANGGPAWPPAPRRTTTPA
jgi:hypothetical protein